MERFPDKQTAKLQKVLERLSRGEIVQNRQLKTLLGIEDYARYLDDYREQEQLRKMIKDKPKEIVECERRLKAATFAYSKADDKVYHDGSAYWTLCLRHLQQTQLGPFRKRNR